MLRPRVLLHPRAARSASIWFRFAAVALLVISIGPSAHAAETYKIDTSNSSVTFEVKHMVINKVHGAFTQFHGELRSGDSSASWQSLKTTIQAASIDTHNAQRDQHLRSEEFFDVERFPQIEFECTRIAKSGEAWIARGTLSLHGVTREIDVPMTIEGPITDPWGRKRIGVEASFVLQRPDYGISWNETLDNGGLVVSDEVRAHVNVEAVATD